MFVGEARLPPGLRIYAVGDVHGRADCLAVIFDLIADDRAQSPPVRSQIVMLGDYTDRGPHSMQVIETLADLTRDADFICLKGNHDQWLEEFLVAPENGDAFLYWGGMETLASYGVDFSSPRQSNAMLSRELGRKMPKKHRRFLGELRFQHVAGDYFFAHAGVRPGIPLEEQDPHDLMWIRDEFLLHEGDFGKVIVHGHTPGMDVDIRRNRINADSRAYETGRLSCIVLENDSHRILQTG